MPRSLNEGLMPAPTFTPHRVGVVAADAASPYAAVKASLDLATLATGALNTVVRARAPGAGGNSITVQATGDRTDGTVVIVETALAVHIHFDDAVSTVAQVEAAITSQSSLIEVQTAGTGATVLDAATDNFAATPLAGGITGISKGHGCDSSGYNEVLADVKVDGADVDLTVLLWSDGAGRYVDQQPTVQFLNLATSKQVRFVTGGQRFFIHVAGTFTRVDIECAGAESAT